MGCSCKSKKIETPKTEVLDTESKVSNVVGKLEVFKNPDIENTNRSIGTYIGRGLIFLAMMTTLPIIMVMVIGLLFKHIVLASKVDILPAVMSIMRGIKRVTTNKVVEEEIEEFEDYEEDEYDLDGVEVLEESK